MVFDAPKEFDILISDLHTDDLHSGLAKQLNLVYLGDAGEGMISLCVEGILWGDYDRPMIPLLVESDTAKKIVFFLVDSGTPFTYLSEEVFNLNHIVFMRIDTHGFV